MPSLPQDQHQRLYVLSVREDRRRGYIRWLFWCPTTAMVAYGLTTNMLSEILYDLIAYGYWRVETQGIECLVATIDASAITVPKTDLIHMKPL
eukprot:2247913-Pyramimonas_sp.AAC.1